ncbi:MAG: 6-phosphofructokinase [Bacteroidia bacterium]|nr:6-phosphofructokinase [Bacteroidia bacterium]MCZ2249905.1 6-phosphofructokinase [Bacteroidia bacterium]
MKKIAVLTSGGDAPGMNACIRAVVRTALYNQIKVTGIKRGYDGLIDADFIELEAQSVSNIMQRGGTWLKTARSDRFKTSEGMKTAYENLLKGGIEGLIVIGGDGTFKGALEFSKSYNIPIIGCPGTIDNDLIGTDFTIGYDTAINTVIEAVDKIRDTAESHDRLFIVEVMGRDAGLIALRSGIGVGAEAILIPETKRDVNSMLERLEKGRKNKSSKIIIVAEGEESGGAFEIASTIKNKFKNTFDVRVSILGHMQRGGSPTCMDRVLASRMGFAAVEALISGRRNEMVGIVNKDIVFTPFGQAVKHIADLNNELLRMVDILSL